MPPFHSQSAPDVLSALGSERRGLTRAEALKRREQYGANALPRAKAEGLASVFFHQFLSPLIYILLIAALVSMALGEWSDAIFIFAVLTINAVIGTLQEFSAQRSALALQQMVTTLARVVRDDETHELNAEELVPGDIVLLESGAKVPADLRLLDTLELVIDESLLTGESLPVTKHADAELAEETALGDRVTLAFAGTMVARGRGRGVVVGIGLDTEIGKLAEAIAAPPTKPPLLLRMERFTLWIALFVGSAALLMAAVALSRGTPLGEVFLMAVALAVSAIPEGLPVALTVALAIGMNRMAKRNVIVRRLVAVEALGSCTTIASDKTGTLTVNRLTVTRLQLPGTPTIEVHGPGDRPEGQLTTPQGPPLPEQEAAIQRLARACVLTNEGSLTLRGSSWQSHGDAVDVALLVMAHKAGLAQAPLLAEYPPLASLPFESELRYSAALNRHPAGGGLITVKGALESLLPMCSDMAAGEGAQPLDAEALEQSALALAGTGFRTLAVAEKRVEQLSSGLHHSQLDGLTLLGVVAMIDPLRDEAAAAVAACADAGIKVRMVTGDHPLTARSIATQLGLGHGSVVSGPELTLAAEEGERMVDALTHDGRVFARVEPRQKLDIVTSLQRQGEFVAVTGDGANDSPALRAAHVGVAMGKSGTDVARETADLIITDDNFASIVAGVEEGRIAYANVRKVIFLLISTGAAELVLFTLSLIANLPIPLLAVQLLWLNLVTNGIQDVALAFEPGEGDELKRPPRPPGEPIFNRLMIERVVLSALHIGVVAFVLFQWLIDTGHSVEEARNLTLLLMVLFENVHVFNSRSEHRSAFRHSPLGNPLLLVGTLAAQAVHIGAMYVPWIGDVLGIAPVTMEQWGLLLLMALSVLGLMELHKLWVRWRGYA